MNKRFVVVDLETTGNAPKKGDRIIQIAAVVIENGEICEKFSSFINPNRPIPPFIEQLTGISTNNVQHAPDFKLIAPEIVSMLENSYFVAHNVPFDLSFLQAELEHNGFPRFSGPTIDTVELSRILLPGVESYKLGHLAENFSLSHLQPHRADSDAEVTAELLLKILDKLALLPIVTTQKLLTLSKGYKSDVQDILIEQIQEKQSKISNDDVTYDTFRGIALKKQTPLQYSRGEDIDYNQFKKGLIKKELKNNHYEYRPEQMKMMDFVYDIQETKQHGLLEGGTGSGKTFAYLIPSIFNAKKNGKQVVISTHTIQLQQQLVDHDLPMICETLPFEVTFSLLKGRSHYLSLRKFEQSLYELDDNYDTTLTKSQILVWLTETTTGDVEEINLPSGGQIYWNTVNVDSTSIELKEDPWEDRCFYKRARQKASQCNLIITNHALLFSDLINEKELIPSYDYLVIDEAHQMDQIASKHLGHKIHYLQIHTIITQLGTLDNNQLLSKSSKIFTAIGQGKSDFMEIERITKDIKHLLDDLFVMMRTYVLEISDDKSGEDPNKISYSFQPHLENNVYWDMVIDLIEQVNHQKKIYIMVAKRQMKLIESNSHMITPFQYGTFMDYYYLVLKLEKIINLLKSLLTEEQSNAVSWIEIDRKGAKNATSIYCQPVDVSDMLADKLFAFKKSVLLTSATLTVRESFNYTINKLGLNDFQPPTLRVSSPFDLSQQAVIMLPNDLPDINEKDEQTFVEELARQLIEIAQITKGRMLVLFTSNNMLRKVYIQLKNSSKLNEYILIAQGISGGSKAKLTKNFKAFNKSILLGTSSFWEGIDIAGEQLSTVIIVRLPFANPSDPIYKAKTELYKAKGLNPFTELALPDAIIRFKQGFGRLIRTKSDKGIVFVMDRRISKTSYGTKFLQAIPEVPVIEDHLENLLNKMDNWLS
ncbi:ATP-dependent DNA helicase DinG [Litchfieldia alkalitelluris]|uniref:ATP-dependent DNA helicase DinG n=1 Tax=Litchfieldia alkalitelluris TaxID=304268 RepID=UPI000998694B|nr:ATP-dependent DNA helicase DinG [Litchfieldia alkalitelluris]